MRFRWIEPMYGFKVENGHVAVPANAEAALREMAGELAGTDDLVGIYVPEGTDEVYEVGAMRGRVVGAVRLLPMPEDKSIEDYFFKDWDDSLRWPIGWPCAPVYGPPVEDCPVLRTQVEYVFGTEAFGSYVARFQHGPFRLEPKMADRLGDLFEDFPKL
jgi:hypothetical protein